MARAPSTFRQQDVIADIRRQSRPAAVERPGPSRRARYHPIEADRTYALKLKPPGGRQNAADAALRVAGVAVMTTFFLDDAVAQLEHLGLLRGRPASISADRVQEQPQ
jgi:hypothetical protein